MSKKYVGGRKAFSLYSRALHAKSYRRLVRNQGTRTSSIFSFQEKMKWHRLIYAVNELWNGTHESQIEYSEVCYLKKCMAEFF
jgi:hypothetical protein